MLSRQEEEAERKAVLENDLRVRRQREQGSTFLSHTHIDDAGGRFATVNAAKIVGQSPGIAASYPAASAAHQTELPPEPPLGYSIDDMPGFENPADSSSVSLSAAPGAPAADAAPPSDCCQPPVVDGVESGAGAPSSSPVGGPDGFVSQPTTVRRERAGPSSRKGSG